MSPESCGLGGLIARYTHQLANRHTWVAGGSRSSGQCSETDWTQLSNGQPISNGFSGIQTRIANPGRRCSYESPSTWSTFMMVSRLLGTAIQAAAVVLDCRGQSRRYGNWTRGRLHRTRLAFHNEAIWIVVQALLGSALRIRANIRSEASWMLFHS